MKSWCAAALVAWAACVGFPAHSAVFTVTKTTDTADGSCDADCSLREAVIAANAAAGSDTIMLPAGFFMLSIPGTHEEAAASGDLDISGPTTIQGAGSTVTVVDGASLDRVFDVHDCGGCTVTIENLTVQHGSAADGGGGGILCYAVGTHLSLVDVRLLENRALGTYDHGGGLQVGNTSDVQLQTCFVADNLAAYGAGVSIGSNAATSSIFDSTITRNAASIAGGGLEAATADASVYGTTIDHNTAASAGGGVTAGYTFELQTCTLSGNAAPDGAAIFAGDPSDSVYVESSTVYRNQGLYALETAGTTRVIDTLLFDEASSGECHRIGVGNFLSSGYNALLDTSCASFAAGDFTTADPQLGPLSWDGSNVRTHYPAAGSPLVNAGLPGGCYAINGPQIFTDQRGESRPYSGDGIGSCDIGSVEYVPEPSVWRAGQVGCGALLWIRRARRTRAT